MRCDVYLPTNNKYLEERKIKENKTSCYLVHAKYVPILFM